MNVHMKMLEEGSPYFHPYHIVQLEGPWVDDEQDRVLHPRCELEGTALEQIAQI